MSGWSLLWAASPSSPSRAVWTVKPQRRRKGARPSMIAASSSTSRTVAAAPAAGSAAATVFPGYGVPDMPGFEAGEQVCVDAKIPAPLAARIAASRG